MTRPPSSWWMNSIICPPASVLLETARHGVRAPCVPQHAPPPTRALRPLSLSACRAFASATAPVRRFPTHLTQGSKGALCPRNVDEPVEAAAGALFGRWVPGPGENAAAG